jgi:hypothetical protein
VYSNYMSEIPVPNPGDRSRNPVQVESRYLRQGNLAFINSPLTTPEEITGNLNTRGRELMARVTVPVIDGIKIPQGSYCTGDAATYREEEFFVFRVTEPGVIENRAEEQQPVIPGDVVVYAGRDVTTLHLHNLQTSVSNESLNDLRGAVATIQPGGPREVNVGRGSMFNELLSPWRNEPQVEPLASREHVLIYPSSDEQVVIDVVGRNGASLVAAVGAEYSFSPV